MPEGTSAGRRRAARRSGGRRRAISREGGFRELTFRMPDPEHWSRSIDIAGSGHVRLLRCDAGRGATRRRVFEVVRPGVPVAEIGASLDRVLPKGAFWVPTEVAHRALVWSVEPGMPPCRAAARSGGFCLSCPLSTPGPLATGATWTLLEPRRPSSERGRRTARTAPPGGASLRAVSEFAPHGGLSDRQTAAVAIALEGGYFEMPRRLGLAGLAQRLGVRPSTAQEHLRRGLGKLLRDWRLSSELAGT